MAQDIVWPGRYAPKILADLPMQGLASQKMHANKHLEGGFTFDKFIHLKLSIFQPSNVEPEWNENKNMKKIQEMEVRNSNPHPM